MGRKRAKRYSSYNAKAYKFTARRRAALKRAQAISARQRRIKVGIMAAGGIAAVGTGLYLGHRMGRGKSVAGSTHKPPQAHPGNAAAAINAVQPGQKEAVRMAGAVSPAHTPRPTIGVGSVPHAPGDVGGDGKPDTSNYTRTRVPDEDPSIVRNEIRAEEAHRKSAEGSLERFTDRSEEQVASILVSGQPVHRGTAARAVGVHESNKGNLGVPVSDREQRRDRVDMMIAGSIETARAVHGEAAGIRPNPRANPSNVIAPGSRLEREALRHLIEQGESRGYGNDYTRLGPSNAVPTITASAQNRTVTPGSPTIGSGASAPAPTPNVSPPQKQNDPFAVGNTIKGWHKIPKDKQNQIRALLGETGKKVSAAGKVSQPGSKPQKPKANPSGMSPQQRAAQTRREKKAQNLAEKGILVMPRGKPEAGTVLGGWRGFTDDQWKKAQAYAARFNMIIDVNGVYRDKD